MLLFNKQTELKDHLQPYINQENSIGFVPTMGAIHQGHLSLMERALNENDWVVVSIFVNPTQFNNPEDLKNYPRTLEADQALMERLSNKIIIYAPEADDLYGDKMESIPYQYDGLEFEMEGVKRPGHFDGVGTVVKKLFEAVRPTRAYFGEKDFQQLQIIRKLNEKENLGVEVVGCDIYRSEKGLALSSRNALLTDKGREDALFMYQILREAQAQFPNKSIEEVKKMVEMAFANQSVLVLDYFEIADEQTLKTAFEKEQGKSYRAFLVAYVENIRLIDNISLN